jgi:hypothetical protein
MRVPSGGMENFIIDFKPTGNDIDPLVKQIVSLGKYSVNVKLILQAGVRKLNDKSVVNVDFLDTLGKKKFSSSFKGGLNGSLTEEVSANASESDIEGISKFSVRVNIDASEKALAVAFARGKPIDETPFGQSVQGYVQIVSQVEYKPGMNTEQTVEPVIVAKPVVVADKVQTVSNGVSFTTIIIIVLLLTIVLGGALYFIKKPTVSNTFGQRMSLFGRTINSLKKRLRKH